MPCWTIDIPWNVTKNATALTMYRWNFYNNNTWGVGGLNTTRQLRRKIAENFLLKPLNRRQMIKLNLTASLTILNGTNVSTHYLVPNNRTFRFFLSYWSANRTVVAETKLLPHVIPNKEWWESRPSQLQLNASRAQVCVYSLTPIQRWLNRGETIKSTIIDARDTWITPISRLRCIYFICKSTDVCCGMQCCDGAKYDYNVTRTFDCNERPTWRLDNIDNDYL